MSTNIAVGICVLISIPFLWTFFSKFFKLQKKSFCLFLKNIYLDESSLHQQPLFWLLITLPVIVSITLWSIISSEYKLEWTAHGYAGLIKYSQLPLMMLALSPILGAFVISAHRSLQTAKQIEIANIQLKVNTDKNKVDKFYSDKKDLYELIGYMRSCNGEKILNVGSILLKAFDIKNYEKQVNDDFIELINKFIAILDVHMDIGKTIVERNHILSNYGDEDHFHNFRVFQIETEIKKIKKFFYFEINEGSQISDKLNKMFSDVKKKDKRINELSNNEDDRYIESQIRDGIFGQFNVYLAGQLYDAISIINELVSALYMDSDIENLFPDLRLVIKKGNDLNLLVLDL